MSLIEELAATLDAASARLPLAQVSAALERLRSTSELLLWVRQESSRTIGVPELAGATEHLEQAGRALQVAQDSVATYLAAIGVAASTRRPPDDAWRAALERPAGHDRDGGDSDSDAGQRVAEARGRRPEAPRRGQGRAPEGQRPQARLGRWWAQRVGVLTDGPDETGRGPQPGTAATGAGRQAGEPPELLRRVARHIRSGNRDALRRELADAPPPVGLELAAISPPVLHRLAGDLLGHQPRGADLPALARATRDEVRALLPSVAPGVIDTLLARVCRVPPPRDAEGQAHPADSAVTGAVLVGVLLHRLGRDPDTLRPDAPEPPSARPGTEETDD